MLKKYVFLRSLIVFSFIVFMNFSWVLHLINMDGIEKIINKITILKSKYNNITNIEVNSIAEHNNEIVEMVYVFLL